MRIDTTPFEREAAEEARAEALRDSDTLADWLGGCCYLAKVSAFQPVQRDTTAIDYVGWSAPDLVALLFDQGQPANITRAARDVLAERFLAAPSVGKWVEARAAEIAIEKAYQAKEHA